VSVHVRSNSPVTVGSIVTFHASLCNLNRSLRNESFVYVWTSDAVNHNTGFFAITAATANTTANISRTFSRHVTPGHYMMEVQVFRKQDVWLMGFSHLRPVAVGFHNFTLTGISWCFFVFSTRCCMYLYVYNWLVINTVHLFCSFRILFLNSFLCD